MKTKLFERLVTKFSIKVNDLAKYLDISKATIYNYRNLDSFEEIPNDKRMKILYLFGKNTTEELELILDESDADILAKYINRINSILNESINTKKESLVSIESLTSNVAALVEENAALKKQLATLSKFGDLDEFTKIYDNLPDKAKYSDDIVKLLLTTLSKSLNIPNKDYELQHNEQLDNTKASEKIIEENNDNIENDKGIETSIDKDDFDIDIFLNDLYDEYIKAKEDKDYYKARDILLKYDYYCREYNIEFNCFNDLYKLTNNINKLNYDKKTNDKITSLIHEIIKCLKKKDVSKNKEKIEILLDEFKTIPNYNNNYYYHRLKGDYFKLLNKFNEVKKEYKKAIEINPYNKQDYYFLARIYFYMVYSKSDCKNALKYIDKFIYYNDSTLTPNQLSHLVNIYIFNFKSYEAMEILDKVEDFDIDYKNEFYKDFVSLYNFKYDILKEVQFKNAHAKTFFDNDYRISKLLTRDL